LSTVLFREAAGAVDRAFLGGGVCELSSLLALALASALAPLSCSSSESGRRPSTFSFFWSLCFSFCFIERCSACRRALSFFSCCDSPLRDIPLPHFLIIGGVGIGTVRLVRLEFDFVEVLGGADLEVDVGGGVE